MSVTTGKSSEKGGGRDEDYLEGLAELTVGDQSKKAKRAPTDEEVKSALITTWGDLDTCKKYCNPYQAAEMLGQDYPEWDPNATEKIALELLLPKGGVDEDEEKADGDEDEEKVPEENEGGVTDEKEKKERTYEKTEKKERTYEKTEKKERLDTQAQKEKKGKRQGSKKEAREKDELSTLMDTVTQQIAMVLSIVESHKSTKLTGVQKLTDGTRGTLKSLLTKFNQMQRQGGTKTENLIPLTTHFSEILKVILKLPFKHPDIKILAASGFLEQLISAAGDNCHNMMTEPLIQKLNFL